MARRAAVAWCQSYDDQWAGGCGAYAIGPDKFLREQLNTLALEIEFAILPTFIYPSGQTLSPDFRFFSDFEAHGTSSRPSIVTFTWSYDS